MRDTVFCLVGDADHERRSATSVARDGRRRSADYVPGYRLKQKVQFTPIGADEPCTRSAAGRAR